MVITSLDGRVISRERLYRGQGAVPCVAYRIEVEEGRIVLAAIEEDRSKDKTLPHEGDLVRLGLSDRVLLRLDIPHRKQKHGNGYVGKSSEDYHEIESYEVLDSSQRRKNLSLRLRLRELIFR